MRRQDNVLANYTDARRGGFRVGTCCWPLDRAASHAFGKIAAELRRIGRPMKTIDIKLAAIAMSLGDCTEISRLRKEVAEAKKAAANVPDDHNYNEAETRDYFIDLLLKESGWPLDQKSDREFPVTGMPNRSLSLRESSSGDERHFRGAKGDNQGEGFVDAKVDYLRCNATFNQTERLGLEYNACR